MNLEYLRSDRVARQKPVNTQNVGHMASETRAMRRTAFHLLVWAYPAQLSQVPLLIHVLAKKDQVISFAVRKNPISH